MQIPNHLYNLFQGYWKRGLYKGMTYGDAFYQFLHNYPLFDPVEAQSLLGNSDFKAIEAWIQARLS